MNVAETIFLNVLVGVGEPYYAPTCKVMWRRVDSKRFYREITLILL